MINKGDIVNFYSTVASFQRDYRTRNPGLVIASKVFPNSAKSSFEKNSAYILWADGSMTREYTSYLKVVENV